MRRNALLYGIVAIVGLAPTILVAAYLISAPAASEVSPEEDTGEIVSGHGKAKPKAKAEPKAKHETKAKHAPPKPKAHAKAAPAPKKTDVVKGPPAPPELPSLKDLAPLAKPIETTGQSNTFPISVPKTFPAASQSNADDVPGGAVADAPPVADPNGADALAEEGLNGPVRRLLRREGSEIRDVVGSITKRGSNILFAPNDHSTPLILLEGQLLERVEFYQQVQTRLGRELPWRISGLITEYRGSNYLLITAATLLEQPANSQVDPIK